MSCVLVVHKCCECKKEFFGGWAERFCQSCKDVRQRRFARDLARRQKDLEVGV